MPIMYVNPAPRRRSAMKRRVKPLRGVTIGKTSRRAQSARRKKGRLAVRNAARRTRKGTSMARKLYGAAAKAHAKRLSKTRRKRKRNPAKRHARRRARRNPSARKSRRHIRRRNPDRSKHRLTEWDFENERLRSAKASRAARKGAKKRKAKAAAAARKPRRAKSSRKAYKPRKKSTSARRAAARRARRSGIGTLRRARRIIRRSPRKILNRRTARYVRKYKMHSNPRRRHARRNPGLSGVTGPLMSGLKAAVPVALSLYLTRLIINKVGPSIPMVDKLGTFKDPAVAGLMVVAANFATKKGPLAKYRSGIMLGTSLNLVDTLVKAFAPDSVKGMFGLGDSGMYDQAMGEFVTVGDYLQVGDAEPIDDDIALSDYVETSGVEEELGALQEELGVEEELGNGSPFGDSGPNRLGGIGQSTMMKALRSSSAVGVVPQRSFVKAVPHAGAGYDNPRSLYTGIFGGGF